jgi:hypothetical protein
MTKPLHRQALLAKSFGAQFPASSRTPHLVWNDFDICGRMSFALDHAGHEYISVNAKLGIESLFRVRYTPDLSSLGYFFC